MTNITATVLETLASNSSGGWLIDIGANNSHESDTLSFIIAPLAAMSRHPKHHSVHPELVSPVTLSSEWSRLARLISLTILSVIGSVGNIFMISSVMIEDHLKKAGKQGGGEENFDSIRESCENRLFLPFHLAAHKKGNDFHLKLNLKHFLRLLFNYGGSFCICRAVNGLAYFKSPGKYSIYRFFLGSSSAKATIFLKKTFRCMPRRVEK